MNYTRLRGIIPSWEKLYKAQMNYTRLGGIIPDWEELCQAEKIYTRLRAIIPGWGELYQTDRNYIRMREIIPGWVAEWPHTLNGCIGKVVGCLTCCGCTFESRWGCTDLYYARGAQEVLHMRVGGATSQLDLTSLTPLSVAGCGWLQLWVPHWAASVHYCKYW